jgi:hypothetical protein
VLAAVAVSVVLVLGVAAILLVPVVAALRLADSVNYGGHMLATIAMPLLALAVPVRRGAGDAQQQGGDTGGDGQERTRGHSQAGAAARERRKRRPNCVAPMGPVLHVPCPENS